LVAKLTMTIPILIFKGIGHISAILSKT
jgi:hypothetical protein